MNYHSLVTHPPPPIYRCNASTQHSENVPTHRSYTDQRRGSSDILFGELRAADKIYVNELVAECKSRGMFDSLRRECLADVDTKPSYQNLRTRVLDFVALFLKQQKWMPSVNRIELRDRMIRQLSVSSVLRCGIDRIVDQVLCDSSSVHADYPPRIRRLMCDMCDTVCTAADTTARTHYLYDKAAYRCHQRAPPPCPGDTGAPWCEVTAAGGGHAVTRSRPSRWDCPVGEYQQHQQYYPPRHHQHSASQYPDHRLYDRRDTIGPSEYSSWRNQEHGVERHNHVDSGSAHSRAALFSRRDTITHHSNPAQFSDTKGATHHNVNGFRDEIPLQHVHHWQHRPPVALSSRPGGQRPVAADTSTIQLAPFDERVSPHVGSVSSVVAPSDERVSPPVGCVSSDVAPSTEEREASPDMRGEMSPLSDDGGECLLDGLVLDAQEFGESAVAQFVAPSPLMPSVVSLDVSVGGSASQIDHSTAIGRIEVSDSDVEMTGKTFGYSGDTVVPYTDVSNQNIGTGDEPTDRLGSECMVDSASIGERDLQLSPASERSVDKDDTRSVDESIESEDSSTSWISSDSVFDMSCSNDSSGVFDQLKDQMATFDTIPDNSNIEANGTHNLGQFTHDFCITNNNSSSVQLSPSSLACHSDIHQSTMSHSAAPQFHGSTPTLSQSRIGLSEETHRSSLSDHLTGCSQFSALDEPAHFISIEENSRQLDHSTMKLLRNSSVDRFDKNSKNATTEIFSQNHQNQMINAQTHSCNSLPQDCVSVSGIPSLIGLDNVFSLKRSVDRQSKHLNNHLKRPLVTENSSSLCQYSDNEDFEYYGEVNFPQKPDVKHIELISDEFSFSDFLETSNDSSTDSAVSVHNRDHSFLKQQVVMDEKRCFVRLTRLSDLHASGDQIENVTRKSVRQMKTRNSASLHSNVSRITGSGDQ